MLRNKMKLHELYNTKTFEGFETKRGYMPSRIYQHNVKEYNSAKLMAKSCRSTGDEKSADMYDKRAQEFYDKIEALDKEEALRVSSKNAKE
jgi:hypothetical protein